MIVKPSNKPLGTDQILKRLDDYVSKLQHPNIPLDQYITQIAPDLLKQV